MIFKGVPMDGHSVVGRVQRNQKMIFLDHEMLEKGCVEDAIRHGIQNASNNLGKPFPNEEQLVEAFKERLKAKVEEEGCGEVPADYFLRASETFAKAKHHEFFRGTHDG